MKISLVSVLSGLLALSCQATAVAELPDVDSGANLDEATRVELQAVYGAVPDPGLGEEFVELVTALFIGAIVADGLGADLLDFTTLVAVGVEREAVVQLSMDKGWPVGECLDPNPLTELIAAIESTFGSDAAAFIQESFDGLIADLGPELLADVQPQLLCPDFDVDNGEADTATATIPADQQYILDIGNVYQIGDGEFARTTLGMVDGDGDDSDIFQLLSELLTGRSQSNLDFEFQPGIVDVQLSALSRESYSIDIIDGGYIDSLTFDGPGAAAAISDLAAPINLRDRQNGLSIINVGVDKPRLGGLFFNPIFDLVGRYLNSKRDVERLLDAAVSWDPRIELMSCNGSSFSIYVHNYRTGSTDILILHGTVVEGVLECV